jgi:excisionase family DNA binding protein
VNNLREYLRIKDAADYLGVSQGTLRNWERVGKILTHRHPINGYRLYRRADLDALLRAVERSAKVRQGTVREKTG